MTEEQEPGRRNRGGRPLKLTPEVHDKIVNLIQRGNYPEVAARFSGIDRSTFFDWIKRGQREAMAGKSNRFTKFSDAVEKAAAVSEVADVENIRLASQKSVTVKSECLKCKNVQPVTVAIPGEWTASAWRLERKNAARWGRKDQLNVAFSKADLEAFATELGRAVEEVIEAALEPDDAKIVLEDIKERWGQLLSDRGADAA